MRRPQGAGCAVTVAGGNGQWCALGHGYAGIAHHFGEGTQPHDLRSQSLGHSGGVQQAAVGELGVVAHDLFGRTPHRDQPALGLHARGRLNPRHRGIHERRRIGHDFFQRIHHHRGGDLRQQLNRLDLLEILLRQRVDHKGKAVHALVAVGMHDAWLRLQPGDDLQVVVFQNVHRVLAGGGTNHRVQQVGAHHMAVDARRAVNHCGHTLVAQRGHALVVHGGGNDNLAGQLFQTKVVQFVCRCHDHRGLLHGLAQHEARPLFYRPRSDSRWQTPVLHIVGAGGVKVERVERTQQLRHPQLQQRVGTLQVGGVLGHGDSQLVVG